MCLAVLGFAYSVLAASPKEKVIYSFRGVPDAATPEAGLIFDAAGNLYGTSDSGGAAACGTGCGTIFELRPDSHGNWREQVLYRFTGSDELAPDYGLVLRATCTAPLQWQAAVAKLSRYNTLRAVGSST
jgi:uncharacterized repeat protein (TIGR03803 family)